MHISMFGGGGSDFFLNSVNCIGNESNVFDCEYMYSSRLNCGVGREEAGPAGVICIITPGNNCVILLSVIVKN